jgi:hypothetical protein
MSNCADFNIEEGHNNSDGNVEAYQNVEFAEPF